MSRFDGKDVDFPIVIAELGIIRIFTFFYNSVSLVFFLGTEDWIFFLDLVVGRILTIPSLRYTGHFGFILKGYSPDLIN